MSIIRHSLSFSRPCVHLVSVLAYISMIEASATRSVEHTRKIRLHVSSNIINSYSIRDKIYQN